MRDDMKIKDRIRRGELVAGIWVPFTSPDVAELCGLLGFDFVFVDGEHGLLAPDDCARMVRAADAVGVATFVRVPRNDAPTILAYVETGAEGIVVPHVRTAGDARAAVDAVKFPPLGHRSAMYSSRAAAYGVKLGPAEYCAHANERTVVVALVEEVEGVRDLELIGAVPGIDLVFIGDGDLSMDMGYPGRHDHPAVREAVADAIARGRAAGIRIGMCAFAPEAVAPLVDSGVSWTMTTATTLLLTAGRTYLAAVRDAATAAARSATA